MGIHDGALLKTPNTERHFVFDMIAKMLNEAEIKNIGT
jgi:hypothetical protein